jgi:Peptidase family M1 domain
LKKAGFLFLNILLCNLHLLSQTQKAYFQQVVDYKIDVSLNEQDNSLDGFETISYTNNSPDTLSYIWFHLYPNAFKNDRTAFSEQMLKLGRTDFYFSNEEERGYINRLDFKVNGITAQLEDHPLYIDVARLILPEPLAPRHSIEITTPFHEKLPFNFSGEGRMGHDYQITQWYPKPAVYDNRGWHPMPYLAMGEIYSEFGNYDVKITVPGQYIVAATGILQNTAETEFLLKKAGEKLQITKTDNSWRSKRSHGNLKSPINNGFTTQEHDSNLGLHEKEYTRVKTLHYVQDSIVDFVWFANKSYLVRTDTIRLSSGKTIRVWCFFLSSENSLWKNSIQLMKDAIRSNSEWFGDYPYDVVTTVESGASSESEMGYPTISGISPVPNIKKLDLAIERGVEQNWSYDILASDGRDHPWMNEGLSAYFDTRYKNLKYPIDTVQKKTNFIDQKLPDNSTNLYYRTQIADKLDQPIATSSENFSKLNYYLIASYKTGIWMKALENYLGEPLFDSCLHQYYKTWKFKHPYPEDFKNIVENVSKKNVDSMFELLNEKGGLAPQQPVKIKVSSLFNLNQTDKYRYLFLSPSVGYNYYDKFMIGGLIHNYTLPSPAFHFFVAPMFSTNNGSVNGIERIGYNILSYGPIRKIEFALSGEKFNMDEYTDSTGSKNYMGFTKLVPSVKITFRNKTAASTIKKTIQWKTYLIKETSLLFSYDSTTSQEVISYPKTRRYLNQLQATIEDTRALYPYSGNLKVEQANNFIRLAFEGKYFFNYPKGGGMNVRLFGGKFIYLGPKTITKEFETDRYHLDMTGPNGNEDYTYSNYFIGRNEFNGFLSQQIMISDGGFKVRSDLLANKIGKTDDWLAAANFVSSIPEKYDPLQVLPLRIRWKLFLDAGTYAGAWKNNPSSGKFIYDAGIQLPLLKGLIHFYFPLVYSNVFRDYFRSTLASPRFWKTVSFSIDIQNFDLSKFFKFNEVRDPKNAF